MLLGWIFLNGKQATKRLQAPLITNPLFLDLGLTAATEFTVLVTNAVVISLLGRKLGAVALGEYLLLRRVYSWLQSAGFLGLRGALPRYVAHAVDKPARERDAYFVAAVVCGSAVTACLAATLNAGQPVFARWFFGSAERTYLILPLLLFFAGGAARDLVYGYYRGRLAMKRANALQFSNSVLVPIAVVLLFFRQGSVARIVSAMGISMLMCAGLFAAPLVPAVATAGVSGFGRHARELLRYGIPRLPAGFGQGAIFALAPMIAAHYLPMAQVASLLLGVSLLMLVSASIEPLGLILLSKVSMMLAQRRIGELRDCLAHLEAAVLELYVFACLQLLVFADILVRAWAGPRFLEGITVIRVVVLAIPFYLFFTSLRNVIDAASRTPYNAYNILAAAGVCLGLGPLAAKIMPPRFKLEGIAGAMVAAIIVLAWLTVRTVTKLYDLRLEWRRSAPPLLLAVVLAGTGLALRWAQGFRTGLGQFILIELVTAVVFVGLLRPLGSGWLPFFWNLAFPHPARAVEIGTGLEAD